jgi:sterol desaturase/sphingolipid hydroxylase (fatty acid hydroxylase superfamily)
MDGMAAYARLPLLLFAFIAALEAIWLTRRGRRYDWKGYWASFGDAVGRALLGLLIQGGVVAVLLYAIWDFRLTTIAMDRVWHWIALFLGQEFCYYWMHRADHRVRWFWLNHSVHHSAEQYNLSTAYRLGWTGKLTGAAVFFGPLVWLGFPVPYVVAALAGNLLYQYWLHTELVPRLPGVIEFVFNTPSHHRVHHASNPEYLDCNYGGVLIVFDRLFGTYREERATIPIRYGLVEPVHSYNPVAIVLHSWVKLVRALHRARGFRQIAMTLFGPPEYFPEDRHRVRQGDGLETPAPNPPRRAGPVR